MGGRAAGAGAGTPCPPARLPPQPSWGGPAPKQPVGAVAGIHGGWLAAACRSAILQVVRFYEGYELGTSSVYLKRHPDGRPNGEVSLLWGRRLAKRTASLAFPRATPTRPAAPAAMQHATSTSKPHGPAGGRGQRGGLHAACGCGLQRASPRMHAPSQRRRRPSLRSAWRHGPTALPRLPRASARTGGLDPNPSRARAPDAVFECRRLWCLRRPTRRAAPAARTGRRLARSLATATCACTPPWSRTWATCSRRCCSKRWWRTR